jgi:hypothetical protein
MFSAKGLHITQEMINQFLELHYQNGPEPFLLTAFPCDTSIRCRLTDTIEEYLGSTFDGFYNLLDGTHNSYGPHVDSTEGLPDVLCRLNILLCGHPGRIQYYKDECRPLLSSYPEEYFEQSNWYFQNNRASMWDFADPELVPSEVFDVDYPAFIKTDKIHAVVHDPKHRGERRIVLSVPIISSTYEDVKEQFDV